MSLSRRLSLVAFLALFAVLAFRVLRPDPPSVILGSVHSENGAPVVGAKVRYQGEAAAVSTDALGRFRVPRQQGKITASKEGYLIAGSDAASMPLSLLLEALPEGDAEDYAWVEPTPKPGAPGNCGNCHGAMYREWAASGHARSVTGKHFRNLYEGSDWHGRPDVGWGLLRQYPEGSGVCTSCHAPTVKPGDEANLDLRLVKEVARDGVHCDYCHKITDAGLGTVGLTHGRDGIRLKRPSTGQLFFGPLEDVDRGEDSFLPLYRQSRYCASCHEGTVFGVHVYSTYSEWLESPAKRAGKQCQTCHMTPTGTMSNFAPGHGGVQREPATLASHRFAGGTIEMLRRALTVNVELNRSASGLGAAVTVEAGAVGHRVPTGFVDRNLVLLVEPEDEAGRSLAAEAGPTLPLAAGKAVSGRPGRLFAKLLHDTSGHSPVPFWSPAAEPTDSRLYPGRPERVVFQFPSATRRVRVRLLYRRFWPEVAEAKGWPENEIVVFERRWEVGER